MATWEDGPEYAPGERPSEYAVPQVAPLEDAAPRPLRAAEAPADRPQDYRQDEQRPLATLVSEVEETRDPHQPFDVASSTLTDEQHPTNTWNAVHSSAPADSPWAPPGGAPAPLAAPASGGWHDPTQPFRVSQQTAPSTPPPAGWPAPGQQWPGPQGPPGAGQSGQQWPAPGTPGWFGPGPSEQPHLVAPQTGDQFARALLRGVGVPTLILLLLGLIQPLAPLTFIGAWACATRLPNTLRKPALARCYYVCFGIIGLLTVLGAVSGENFWDVAGLTACWLSIAMLVISTVLVATALRSGRDDTPSSYWG